MPVGKRAGRVFLPRPHVQRVEIRQTEAIGAFEQVHELPAELRRGLIVGRPGAGEHEEVGADEPKSAVWRETARQLIAIRLDAKVLAQFRKEARRRRVGFRSFH